MVNTSLSEDGGGRRADPDSQDVDQPHENQLPSVMEDTCSQGTAMQDPIVNPYSAEREIITKEI